MKVQSFGLQFRCICLDQSVVMYVAWIIRPSSMRGDAGSNPSWETQGLLVGTIFGRATFLAQKFISRTEEPLGTFSYQKSSRSVEIRPADWPEIYFFGQKYIFLANQRGDLAG